MKTTNVTVRKWSVYVLVLGSLLIAQTSPAKDKQSVKPVDQAVVVDAEGDKVGGVVGLNGPLVQVLIEAGGSLFSLNVTKTQLLATGGPLYFTTVNCTGTPYVTAQPPGLVFSSTLAAPGNSLYEGMPGATPQLIIALSFLPPAPPGAPPICLPTVPPPPPAGPPPPPPPQVFAVPALRLVDLNTVFTAPFRIRTDH